MRKDINSPMSLNGYAYAHGNPVNDAVGELIFKRQAGRIG
jgi:hypothetical protein